MYNDLGEAIGKFKDYGSGKFDVRIIAGSTLPINRWAYLDELKQLMQLGVVDDIALLAETDIRNKEQIAKRKSMYAQMQSQISSMEEQLKNASGTIETLERQVVQAGIKNKVMQASVEVDKKKNQVQTQIEKESLLTKAQQQSLRESRKNKVDMENRKLGLFIDSEIKNLRNKEKSK